MTAPSTRTLILGGIRSGKSAIAEGLLGDRPATYLATGPTTDDADWAERVRAHQARRPATWTTVESSDVAGTLDTSTGPVLIDAVPTWLSAQLDAVNAWDTPATQWQSEIYARIDAFADSVAEYPDRIIVVSQEVGLSLIPENRAGRIFADWLGLTNQSIASRCDEVLLVVAGRTLTIGAP